MRGRNSRRKLIPPCGTGKMAGDDAHRKKVSLLIDFRRFRDDVNGLGFASPMHQQCGEEWDITEGNRIYPDFLPATSFFGGVFETWRSAIDPASTIGEE
jgi:hypothetical protein